MGSRGRAYICLWRDRDDRAWQDSNGKRGPSANLREDGSAEALHMPAQPPPGEVSHGQEIDDNAPEPALLVQCAAAS
jgi:hypothetical protein